MKLKVDDKGAAVLIDGMPVYQHDDGTEAPFDAKAANVKIATLSRESAEKRTALKEATDKLAAFAGIEDPAAALKALQFAASMDGKKVMDDDGIQKLIQAAVKPLQEAINTEKAANESVQKELYAERVSKQFATSQFLTDKTVLTPDIAEAAFGKHFKMEGGKVVAVDGAGNQIFSTARPGEPANFEEAISALVGSYPLKDRILKAAGTSGTGAQQTTGTQIGTDKYAGMSATDRITAARAAGATT